MTSSIVVGLDIGTTSSKAVAWSASRHGRPFTEQSTPWQTDACGQTEIRHDDQIHPPHRLIGIVVRVE